MDQPQSQSKGINKLTGMASAMLGLLSLQFILGRLIALYVTLPSTSVQTEQMKELYSHWQYMGHIIVGSLLVLFGIMLTVGSFKAKHSMMKILSVVGLLALLLASYGGRMYVQTYHASDALLMAVGFIVAMGVYGRFLSLAMMDKPKA